MFYKLFNEMWILILFQIDHYFHIQRLRIHRNLQIFQNLQYYYYYCLGLINQN